MRTLSATTDAGWYDVDRFPRVLLVDGLGLVTVGSSVKDCNIAADIYEHTVPVICAAASLGGFSPVSEADLFDCEYWELEQRKLKLGKKSPGPLDGKICYVTGGASGMGQRLHACSLSRGAMFCCRFP